MSMFIHSLVLGFGVASLGAFGLSEAGLPAWVALLVAWIGGNALGLGLAMAGAALWPDKPARRSSFTATEEEFRLWDDDLTRELIDASVRHDKAPAAASGPAPETAPLRAAG